jgi:hypothetical protein
MYHEGLGPTNEILRDLGGPADESRTSTSCTIEVMSAYRDDLEAAVHRASALEVELQRAKQKQREDRAGYLVKVTELDADLAAERERLNELADRIANLSGQGNTAENVIELEQRLEASRARLDELDTDVRSVRAEGARGSRLPLLALVAGVVAVLAVAISATLVLRSMARADLEAARRSAAELLWRGTYSGHMAAAAAVDRLLADHGDDATLLADAARIRALLALEHGTDDDREAESLIARAAVAGATVDQLAAARVALSLARWNMAEADRVLLDSMTAGGDDASELIYLRGVWYLRRGNPREAHLRFVAAAESNLQDTRFQLATATARYEMGSQADALPYLDSIRVYSPNHVGGLLLRTRMDIESGRDPQGADRLAQTVLDLPLTEASHTEREWALLYRARALLLLGRREDARVQLIAARALRPTRDPEFRSFAARISVALGDLEAAEDEARRATVIAPEIDRFQRELAEVLIARGELERAETILQAIGAPAGDPLRELIRARRAAPEAIPEVYVPSILPLEAAGVESAPL